MFLVLAYAGCGVQGFASWACPTLNDQGFSRLGSSAVSKVLSISLRLQVPKSSGVPGFRVVAANPKP